MAVIRGRSGRRPGDRTPLSLRALLYEQQPMWLSRSMRSTAMAVVVSMDFAGVTPEQYDAVINEMNLQGRPYHDGGIFHVAWQGADDHWRVVDVWESAEQFQQFANEQIMP